MSQSLLAHQFQVSKVPVTYNTDVFETVRKRKEQVVYAGSSTTDNINLAWAASPPVTPDSNLFLSDHSTSIVANRVSSAAPITFTAASYSIETEDFILTDAFTSSTATQPSLPLFYKHLISTTRFDPTDITQSLIGLTILDSTFAPVANITQLLSQSTVHDGVTYWGIFNNLVNTYNKTTNTPTVYYLKYTIKKSSAINTYVEILNNLPVYREASFQDLDNSGNLKTDRKVYLISEEGSLFSITMAVSQRYGVQQLGKSRISLIKPQTTNTLDSWFMKTTNGSFYTNKFNGSAAVKYAIAEFNNQIFNPFAPYKKVSNEVPQFLNGTLYKLNFSNIFVNPAQGLTFVVNLLDSDGNISQTLSLDNGSIRSLDQLNGFLDLTEKPLSSLTVSVSYTYKETEYEIRDIDFNPVDNIGIRNTLVVFYVVPQSSPLDQSLFYLLVDRTGKIISSSEATLGDFIGTDISGRMAAPFGLYYNRTNPFVLSTDPNYLSFVDRYTVETALATTDPVYTSNPALLILGEVYVGESIAIDEVSLVDIRVRGGGIKDNQEATVLQNGNFETKWNWDLSHWDGIPYPGTATYFVEIPTTSLSTHGGVFDPNSIRPVVERHTALGIYPIIKLYGKDPLITSNVITTTTVNLTWTYQGPGITYNIYMGTTGVDGAFTKVNNVAIASNTYTVTTLTSQTNYWFYVTSIDTNGFESADSSNRFTLNLQTR